MRRRIPQDSLNHQVDALVGMIYGNGDISGMPPIMGLRKAVVITLAYVRSNRTQAELAECHGLSQPTISHTITAMTAVIAAIAALRDWVLTLDHVSPGTAYVSTVH